MGCIMREIEYHEEFSKELDESIRLYSIDLERLYRFLAVLKEKGTSCIVDPYFGEVKNSKFVYELRLKKGRPNLRILFAFSKDTKIVLLSCMFYEKNTKKDYARNIPKAEKRTEEWFARIGKEIKRRS